MMANITGSLELSRILISETFSLLSLLSKVIVWLLSKSTDYRWLAVLLTFVSIRRECDSRDVMSLVYFVLFLSVAGTPLLLFCSSFLMFLTLICLSQKAFVCLTGFVFCPGRMSRVLTFVTKPPHELCCPFLMALKFQRKRRNSVRFT